MTPSPRPTPGFSPFRAFVGTSLSSVLVTALTFVSGVLAARVLGPVARGDYGTAMLVITSFATLGCLSFFNGALLCLRNEEDRIPELIPSMLAALVAITLVAAAGLALLLPVLPITMETVSTRALYVLAVVYMALLMLGQCFSAAERGKLSFDRVNLSRVAAPLGFSVLLVAAWALPGIGLSAVLVLGLFMVSKLPELAILAWGYLRHAPGRLDGNFLRRAFTLGLRLHGAVALGALSAQIDRIVAVGVWDSALLGQYFVAYSAVGAGFAVLTTAINLVLMPYLAGLSGPDRPPRVMRIFRLAMLISGLAVLVGATVLPWLIPLVYGRAYDTAATLAAPLVLAMAALPLRAVVMEASRSRGRGWPAIELSLVSMGVMVAGYLLTAYVTPNQLITAFALANLLSLLAGMRHLWRDGDITLSTGLLPGLSDLRWLITTLRARGRR